MVPGLICPKLDILGQNSQFSCKKRKKMKNICHIHICLCIGIKFCTMVVHKLSKDIIFDAKLKRYKIANLGQNNLILYKNCEKLENICSIYIWRSNGVKVCTVGGS